MGLSGQALMAKIAHAALSSAASARGADDLYDIISALGNESGTAAAASGGFLAELLSLFGLLPHVGDRGRLPPVLIGAG
jgi:hypothetical protein